jgi:hypothetical protein
LHCGMRKCATRDVMTALSDFATTQKAAWAAPRHSVGVASTRDTQAPCRSKHVRARYLPCGFGYGDSTRGTHTGCVAHAPQLFECVCVRCVLETHKSVRRGHPWGLTGATYLCGWLCA